MPLNAHIPVKLSKLPVAWRWLAWLLLCVVLSACSPPQEAARKRFFWPPGNDRPRIEYLASFVSEQDLHAGERDWFAEVVLGLKHPQRAFVNPLVIAAARDGQRIFVADAGLGQVLIFDRELKKIRHLLEPAGKGQRELRAPVMGLAALADGGLVVSIEKPAQIALYGADERQKIRFGGEHLGRPVGLAVDDSRQRIYVADAGSHSLVVFDFNGDYIATWGGRGEEGAHFNFPLDVAVDGEGQIYVLDSLNARVKVLSPEGGFLRAFGERGTSAGSFTIPKALAVSPQNDVYVTDSLGNKVVIFDREGRFLLSFGGHYVAQAGIAPGGMSLPVGIDVDANSTIWVVDSMNRMFHEFQYLTPEYLETHPILPGESYLPMGAVGDGDGDVTTRSPEQ